MVNLNQFRELDLCVATVLKAESIVNSQNLLKLTIDLGTEQRQIVAGIANFYKPEQLIGRQIAVVANLEPKSFLGILSQGMLLAAENDGDLSLLTLDKEMPPGSKIY